MSVGYLKYSICFLFIDTLALTINLLSFDELKQCYLSSTSENVTVFVSVCVFYRFSVADVTHIQRNPLQRFTQQSIDRYLCGYLYKCQRCSSEILTIQHKIQ